MTQTSLRPDGYNWADAQNPEIYCGWQSYDDVFSTALAEIKKLAAGKPWGIAETGSVLKPLSFFEPGGECFDSWGSWVFDSPELGQHYQTPQDWITQHGWLRKTAEAKQDNAKERSGPSMDSFTGILDSTMPT